MRQSRTASRRIPKPRYIPAKWGCIVEIRISSAGAIRRRVTASIIYVASIPSRARESSIFEFTEPGFRVERSQRRATAPRTATGNGVSYTPVIGGVYAGSPPDIQCSLTDMSGSSGSASTRREVLKGK